MNKVTRLFVSALVATSTALVAGCSADAAEDTAPAAEGITLDEQQTVYSTNTSGTWSSTANAPTRSGSQASASATFTGPAGYTRKIGVCLLQRVGTPCTTAADCPAAPAGGFNYCTSPDNVGSKVCFTRPGSQTDYCAGSPALGGAAVAPGTYATPYKYIPINSAWISYGCFEGCAATDPSSSSQIVWECNPGPNRIKSCQNAGGFINYETCACEM